jgi:5-methylcytosine-specific restriction endonuclease McrA
MAKYQQGKWHKLYQSTRWQRVRRAHLQQEPFCRMCVAKGIHTLARVVDHLEPHGGDLVKFYMGQKQSLCFDCHDRLKQQIDQVGYSSEVDADGWPTDPKHPTWSKTAKPDPQAGEDFSFAEDTSDEGDIAI